MSYVGVNSGSGSYLGNKPITETAGTRREWTPTNGQTTFTIQYAVGYLDVFVNGAKLANADFTATNGSSFTLNAAVTDQDLVAAIAWGTGTMEGGGGSGLSPELIVNENLAGVNLNLNPIEWALELGHNYEIKASNLIGGTGIINDAAVELTLRGDVGILVDCFQKGQVTQWQGTLVLEGIENFGSVDTGESNIVIAGVLSSTILTFCSEIKLFCSDLVPDHVGYMANRTGYFYTNAKKNHFAMEGGYVRETLNSVLTHGRVTADGAVGAMQAGSLQVYKLPAVAI